ncbi:MAG: PhzF family phenazine biosynthesis protein [Terriglobales bacterium]
MPSYSYVQLDVFTQKALQGNQLAVFTDARGLSPADMQALARETRLAETTFIFPRDFATEREKGVQVRIFTTEEELPFAGHPTLGTAFLLHGSGRRTQDGGVRLRASEQVINLELTVGKVPVTFSRDGKGQLFGEMTQNDPVFGQIHKKEDIARATGLNAADFDPDLPAQTVSTGLSFVIVPVKSLATMHALSIETKKLFDYLGTTDAKFMYFICREVEHNGSKFHARMIFYNGEDPATGSAAGDCVSWAVKHGVLKSDEQAVIEQGIEMKRPSFIHVRATKAGDGVKNVRVGGYVVEVMRGEATI